MSTVRSFLNRTNYFASSITLNFIQVCGTPLMGQTYNHNGSGSLPTVGDRCKDGSGNVLAAGYYRIGDIADGNYIRIMNSNGDVSSASTCA